MDKRILVVEDDQDLAEILEVHLLDMGFTVDLAFDGVAGWAKVEAENYDLLILDIMLPGIDGLELCRRIRSKESYIPILMLTARTSELDRVLGLELGADDYLTKPFSIKELLARVKALFRRIDAIKSGTRSQKEEILRAGDMEINLQKRSVLLAGKSINLTAREFDLLYFFASHPGRVYTRAQLLDQVWGYGHSGYDHTVNSHINRLRAKIENDPTVNRYIQTVWGVGYKFSDLNADRQI